MAVSWEVVAAGPGSSLACPSRFPGARIVASVAIWTIRTTRLPTRTMWLKQSYNYSWGGLVWNGAAAQMMALHYSGHFLGCGSQARYDGQSYG